MTISRSLPAALVMAPLMLLSAPARAISDAIRLYPDELNKPREFGFERLVNIAPG